VARRVHTVDRNLGDAIRGFGGISAVHLGLLALGYAALQLLELLLRVWSALLGRAAGFLFPLLVTLAAALVLSRIERRHGAHHVQAWLAFHLSRRTRYLFAPHVRPRRTRARLDPEE
jgi:hypothetical protein